MPVVKIDRLAIKMDSYLCDECIVPCILTTYPKPNHCPFGYEGVNWVKRKMKIERRGNNNG